MTQLIITNCEIQATVFIPLTGHYWEIISKFFIPVASDSTFYSKAEQWMNGNEAYPWDTSVMKVVDNLVIGSKKWFC